MRTSLVVIAAAGLFCGFTATPEHERKTRENAKGSITQATQECWTKLKGKAQVEWYGHLRKIDEPGRADAIMMSTMRAVERCVAEAVGWPGVRPGPVEDGRHLRAAALRDPPTLRIAASG